MTTEERIKEIRRRLDELEPLIARQLAKDPGPSPMTTEMAEAEKLKIELKKLLEH
jgi:hypothetical protein